MTDLWDELRDPSCSRCPLGRTSDIVCAIGSGKVPSDVMIIGEAIGKRNNIKIAFEQGSGVPLEEGMANIGLTRDDVFITNIIKCRLTREQNEDKAKFLSKKNVEACRYYLNQEFERVKPKYVLLLGGLALRALLQKNGIMKHRGYFEVRDGVTYFATIHPSYLFQNPRYKSTFFEDLVIFKNILTGKATKETVENILVNSDNFSALLRAATLAPYIALDLETEGLHHYLEDKKILCAGISFEENRSWTFTNMSLLREFLLWADRKGKKLVGHHYKFDEEWLITKGVIDSDFYF